MLEKISPRNFQISLCVTVSSQVAIAPRRASRAYERIPPKPVAPQDFVPVAGISRSIPISAPSAVARRKEKKREISIEKEVNS